MMQSKKYLHIKKRWDFTKQNYIEWVAKNNIKYFCSQNCKIDGLSIWWGTKLVSKDNINFPNWYIDLKNILHKKKYQVNKNNFFWVIFILKLIKNFLFKFFWILLIKILFLKKQKKFNYLNSFHAYDYDFTENKKKIFVNKLYGKIISKSKKNIILITVIKHKFFLKNYFKFKNINNVVFLDKYLSLKDLVLTNFYLLTYLFKLIFYIRNNKKIFLINKKNCKDVLEPLLFESFSGELQNSYLMGKSIFNFLKKNKIKNFITYGEFTPGYRLVYFYVKKIKKHPKITAFQHGQPNSLFNFNKNIEFKKYSKNNDEGVMYSPSPDQYFVQGYKFFKNLKKFYKGRVKIIGSPRYDNFKFIKYKIKKIKKLDRKKKNVLLCTSIGDHEYLFDYISKTYTKKYNYILSSHPDNKQEVFNFYKKKYSSKIKFYTFENYKTSDLIQISDLVITGLSNSSLESQLFGISSIRLTNPERPDNLDPEEEIKIICSVKELKNVLNNNNFYSYKIKNIKKLKKNYFYKLDNKTYKRFWKFL